MPAGRQSDSAPRPHAEHHRHGDHQASQGPHPRISPRRSSGSACTADKSSAILRRSEPRLCAQLSVTLSAVGVPTTAEHAGSQTVCLCILSARRERADLPPCVLGDEPSSPSHAHPARCGPALGGAQDFDDALPHSPGTLGRYALLLRLLMPMTASLRTAFVDSVRLGYELSFACGRFLRKTA